MTPFPTLRDLYGRARGAASVPNRDTLHRLDRRSPVLDCRTHARSGWPGGIRRDAAPKVQAAEGFSKLRLMTAYPSVTGFSGRLVGGSGFRKGFSHATGGGQQHGA